MNSSRTKIALIAAIGILVIAAGALGAYNYLTIEDAGETEPEDSLAQVGDSADDEVEPDAPNGRAGSQRSKDADPPKQPRSKPAGKDSDALKGIARKRLEAQKKALGEGDSADEGEDPQTGDDDRADEKAEGTGSENDGSRPNAADAGHEAEKARAEAQKKEAARKAQEKATAQKDKQRTRKPAKQETWKSAVLQIVTNFEKAEVTVNGLPYPQYLAPGEPEGMTLPAGGPYDVRVTYDGKTKAYRLNLRPNETRLLMVELTGFQGGGNAPPPRKNSPSKEEPEEKAEEKGDEEEQGKVTVYSKPSGTIIIGGNKTGEKTPGTVDIENGRHEVQVEYDHGEMSEKKIIRVRQGSRIKLFFRARNAPE